MKDEFSLDPDAALAREMYAHFGLAVYLAQVFEKGLGNLIAFLLYEEGQGEWSREECNAEIDKLEKKTLGPLLQRVKKAVSFDTDCLRILDSAHSARNFLVHDYFWKNAAKSGSDSGKREVIAEFEKLQAQFREADRIVESVCQALWQKAGISEEVIAKLMNELVDIENNARKS